MRFLSLLVGLFLFQALTAQTIDPKKVDSIRQRARDTHSDGLVIWQNGKVVVEETFNEADTPVYIASISKALSSMAILKLLNDGKIKSIDQPVSDFYPEWNQGQKRGITLRMILSHTSGMQNVANARLEIETGPQGKGDDLVQLALAAELTDTPGKVYSYNNKASGLLAGIIERASGQRMDAYFEETFFKPMNITRFQWKRDGTGRPKSMGGFELTAKDLAKFGQLMLDRGVYNGTRFFEARWVDSAVTGSQQVEPTIGLMWRLHAKSNRVRIRQDKVGELEALGLPDSYMNIVRSFYGRSFTQTDFRQAMAKVYGNNLQVIDTLKQRMPQGFDAYVQMLPSEKVDAFYHTGSWGNYLVVIPSLQVVAVRVVKRDKDYKEETDRYDDFMQQVFQLIN